ncbi:nitroreductase/quinone reductase family protein [Micromonospora sp. NPDC004551]|uniref:nitroreductase/quinone reductase family protein n=1 Tax=Micromonospora sp. NPDC004551 TaxID=3154284 RepID=UPI0033AB7A2B
MPGELRRTALVYERDGDRYVLAASNRGSDHHPAWYLNLLADPYVTVQVGAEAFTACARSTAEERPDLWRLMVSAMSEHAAHQQRTTREIPVVLLERVPDLNGGALGDGSAVCGADDGGQGGRDPEPEPGPSPGADQEKSAERRVLTGRSGQR